MHIYLTILIFYGVISVDSLSLLSEDNIVFDDDAGRLVEDHGNGQCTFEITEHEYVPTLVTYLDFQTYFGRCRGYYFKRCVNERMITKTKMENRLQAKTRQIQKCCHGYIANRDESFSLECVPICETACIHGNCSAPNVCSCHEGFKPHENETHICEPDCIGCLHGTCIEPNLCQCNSGYDWDSERVECVPFCSGSCHNGKCISPERCECDDGFTHHSIESLCIPHCNENCINGYCAEPNKCICYDNYDFVNGSNSVCEPICTVPCINSKCVEPNTCECNDGYTVHNASKQHECSCGLYCAEVDGKCHCLDANQRISVTQLFNDTGICNISSCSNGHCTSPTHCECFDGFEKNENSICVPINETCVDDSTNCNGTDVQGCDCINGICSSNGTCVCLNGFQMVPGHTDRCEPYCSKECVNGVCIDPNTCLCSNENDYHLGYNETEWNICYPICDRDIDDVNGCYNGTCVAPGICECYEGFELDTTVNFTCTPITLNSKQSPLISGSVIGYSFLMIIALVGIVFVAYFAVKKQRQRQLANTPDGKNSKYLDKSIDDPTRPITYEPSEEL